MSIWTFTKNVFAPHGQPLTVKSISEAIVNIRKEKLPDPSLLPNAGSFFKNPILPVDRFKKLKDKFPEMPAFPEGEDHYKIPAGWLIESCSWKGRRTGDVGVYDKQALILVNYGENNGQRLWELAKMIIASVQGKFDIQLEPEVNIL